MQRQLQLQHIAREHKRRREEEKLYRQRGAQQSPLDLYDNQKCGRLSEWKQFVRMEIYSVK